MDNVKGLSYVTSSLSEFMGSHIFKILGYEVHGTELGVCFDGEKYKVVCACKDFINDDRNEILIPYTALRNDSNEVILKRNDSSSLSPSDIDEIIFHLENNIVLSKIKGAKERFWETAIIDMLINNNDRNEDNWGVIKYKNENNYKMAPIYDCGNSFYGKSSEERIEKILSDQEKLKSSALNGVTAYEMNGEKVHTNQILKIDNEDLKKAIVKVYSKINAKKDEIISFINSIPNYYNDVLIISENRKKYYLETFFLRYELILKEEYKKIVNS